MVATPLKVAFQMDPMETVNIDGDSTFVLMLEAQKRGFELYHYLAARPYVPPRRCCCQRQAGDS